MTYLESDLDLVTVLVRLGGHVRLQHPQDTPQKLLSAECLSVVEALAAGFSLDISSVEAKHATNREMAMLKNRGWVESLQCISAKYISKCVGQLSARFKVVFGRAFETKPTPPPTASETNPSQKKTRSKAGGVEHGGHFAISNPKTSSLQCKDCRLLVMNTGSFQHPRNKNMLNLAKQLRLPGRQVSQVIQRLQNNGIQASYPLGLRLGPGSCCLVIRHHLELS